MKKIRVLAFGTFDYFHDGHRDFLRQARELGNELIVVVARDVNVEIAKNIIPTFKESERKKAIIKSGLADKVLLGDSKNKFKIVKKLNPDIIVAGYDQYVPEKELFDLFPNLKIIRLKPYFPEIHKSSLLRKKQNIA